MKDHEIDAWDEFAEMMYKRLEVNNLKGGWHNEVPARLLGKLLVNAFRLTEIITEFDINSPETGKHKEYYDQIKQHCADTANYCMMLVDICKEKK